MVFCDSSCSSLGHRFNNILFGLAGYSSNMLPVKQPTKMFWKSWGTMTRLGRKWDLLMQINGDKFPLFVLCFWNILTLFFCRCFFFLQLSFVLTLCCYQLHDFLSLFFDNRSLFSDLSKLTSCYSVWGRIPHDFFCTNCLKLNIRKKSLNKMFNYFFLYMFCFTQGWLKHNCCLKRYFFL